MMDCKKALTETDGDMDKAIDYLREKGATADEVNRCSSSFGRYVRTAYTQADRKIFDRAWSESYANGFPEKKDKKTKKNKEKK